jgi:pyridoxal phosphate enzyme (YggS family)
LAQEVSKRAGNRAIKILVEVNISYEQQKQGASPEDTEQLVTEIASTYPNLILSGLMGMASFEENPENTRPQFQRLKTLHDRIAERHPELKSFKELSMGMSNDFEVAIECGATIVRIGSLLFGERV